MDFYHRYIPCEVGRGYTLPENVGLLRDVCVTSVNTKYKYFYEFVKVNDPKAKIYIGKDLEDLICRELSMWAQNINVKLKAFSGRDFCSYLNAIPSEVFLKEGFKERMKNALKEGFVKRSEKNDAVTLSGLSELLDVAYELKDSCQKKKEEIASSAFDKNVQDRIAKMKKKTDKELAD